MIMFGEKPGDELHRAVKLALDSSEAATIQEATALFEGYHLAIGVGDRVANSPSLQAAVLTAVNTGRRCFLGGVEVAGALDIELLVPWGTCRTLREAVIDLQGSPRTTLSAETPYVQIGGEPSEQNAVQNRAFAVQATFNGWAGGVIPLADGRVLPEQQEFRPAGVLAGAIAVSEAFQFVRGGNPVAGRRDVGLSLWLPEADVRWTSDDGVGPVLGALPSRLWLIGLGHLGQSYLWTLGFLPYAQPGEVDLVLQDFDTVTRANDSTSPLTTSAIIGQKKTRAMAAWCEARGFRTVVIERHFAANFRVASGEPQLALVGVDNAMARAAIEEVGFARVIEAGLGRGSSEYLAFQVHSFPGPQQARSRWGGAVAEDSSSRLAKLPAYAALAEEGLDECGLTLLAGRSVGSSFVGTAVGALVVSEAIRLAMGGPQYSLIDGHLRTLAGRTAVAADERSNPFNPGLTVAAT
jgi:hypothetical protein